MRRRCRPAGSVCSNLRTEVNVFVGFVFFFWILTPILYYKNVCDCLASIQIGES